MKSRRDSWKIIKQRERQIDAQREKSQNTWCIFTPTYPLTRAFKVSKMKKQNQNLQVPLFPLPDLHHPPSFFLFFLPPLSLSVSFTLLSLSVVCLIGQQTACKCSNPEKSPGALVIGCALQHCSQSIKARWAPVNSFSLLLLWLWYCHIDSNFALNPSTAVLSLSLCLLQPLSLHFFFHFQSLRHPHCIATQRYFFMTLTPGLCYSLFLSLSLFTFSSYS